EERHPPARRGPRPEPREERALVSLVEGVEDEVLVDLELLDTGARAACEPRPRHIGEGRRPRGDAAAAPRGGRLGARGPTGGSAGECQRVPAGSKASPSAARSPSRRSGRNGLPVVSAPTARARVDSASVKSIGALLARAGGRRARVPPRVALPPGGSLGMCAP